MNRREDEMRKTKVSKVYFLIIIFVLASIKRSEKGGYCNKMVTMYIQLNEMFEQEIQ